MADRVTSRQFRPTGTRLTVPSTLTGAPLTYFCPHPVRELAETWLAVGATDAGLESVVGASSGVLLARYLMRHGLLRKAPEQSFFGFDAFFRPSILACEGSLIRLWSEQTGRHQGYRGAISFSGGPSPSTASHIYPPHQEIPRLVADMSAFLNEDWRKFACMDVVALLFYYSLSVHPFPNGNGRWARHVVIAAAAKAGDVWSAAILLVFYANCEGRLIAAWRDAHDYGLDAYLLVCRTFRDMLVEYVTHSPIAKSASDMHERLVGRCGRREADRVYCAIVLTGEIDEEGVLSLLRCSRKKAQGILSAAHGQEGVRSPVRRESLTFTAQLEEFFSGLTTLGWPNIKLVETTS